MFGEEQPPAYLLAILLFGVGVAATFALSAGQMLAGLAWWRAALALVLVLDIAAGCVANFTPSTNDFYAARPRNRWIFIAIHFHVVIVALLVGTGVGAAVAVWAYTIAGAASSICLPDAPHRLLSAGCCWRSALPACRCCRACRRRWWWCRPCSC